MPVALLDVLLIQPPLRDLYLTRGRTSPQGLLAIAGSCAARGLGVELLDALAGRGARSLPLPPALAHLARHFVWADRSPFALFHAYREFGLSPAAVAEAARRAGPRLVGISSLFTAYAGDALRTAEAVRAACPQATIVLGGHHPTALPEEVLACPAVDYVIRGDGELALPLLAEALAGRRALGEVPGLVARSCAAPRAVTPAVALDLDALPPPASELLPPRGRRRAVLVASRGCPLRCSYCSTGAGAPLPYRRRRVGGVLAEAAAAVAAGAELLDFEDENLALDRAWLRELLAALERLTGGGVELRAMNGLLPHTLDEETVRAMARAGFRVLNLSLGSSDGAQLARFRRPDERAALDRALDAAERAGLSAVVYVIAGAPGQAAASSIDDLLYLAARRALAGVSIYYPAPGSEDFARAEAAGLLPAGVGQEAADAYRELRRAQHAARLDDQPTQVPLETMTEQRAAVLALWRAVFG